MGPVGNLPFPSYQPASAIAAIMYFHTRRSRGSLRRKPRLTKSGGKTHGLGINLAYIFSMRQFATWNSQSPIAGVPNKPLTCDDQGAHGSQRFSRLQGGSSLLPYLENLIAVSPRRQRVQLRAQCMLGCGFMTHRMHSKMMVYNLGGWT